MKPNAAARSGTSRSYVVRSGDTLEGIAAAQYGDRDLWWVIAQANALEGRVALVEGSTLQLPQVSRSANGFGTYAPANPAEAIGSTVPQAVPPPPPSQGCGTIGLIIMIVVAVVVTAITAAAAAPAIAQALGVGVNAGISALAGAVGAAAGSIASQGVGMVLGVQQDFSWRQVGLAALGGAVSGALGGIPGADGITQVSPGLIDTGAFARVDTLWGLAQRGGQAMLGNAITQGLAVATGLQDRYQWRQVAASAFAAPVGQLVGSYAGAYMNSFGASLAGGLTSGLIRSAIYNKGKVDYASIAADAFGNAVGNSVVGEMQSERRTVLPERPLTWVDNPNVISENTNWNADGSAPNLLPVRVAVPNSLPDDDYNRGNGLEQAIDSLPQDQRDYFDRIRATNQNISEREAYDDAARSRGLTDADRKKISDAEGKIRAATVSPLDNGSGKRVVPIFVTFDGTWNDREQMPFRTNPALLGERFSENDVNGRALYYRGVGTDPETSLIGGLTGAGASKRIDAAYADVVERINLIRQSDPNVEPVLVISGFSRGSATALAFANVLNERGIPDTNSALVGDTYSRTLTTPRVGGLILFDTVGSFGIPGNNINLGFNLSVPANVENVLHITAGDETRGSFPLTSLVDPARPDPRITQISLPGAHSDIGGGYPNPYSKIAFNMAYDYADRMGLPLLPRGDLAAPSLTDPTLRLHDSRFLTDWLGDLFKSVIGKPPTRTIYDPSPRR